MVALCLDLGHLLTVHTAYTALRMMELHRYTRDKVSHCRSPETTESIAETFA